MPATAAESSALPAAIWLECAADGPSVVALLEFFDDAFDADESREPFDDCAEDWFDVSLDDLLAWLEPEDWSLDCPDAPDDWPEPCELPPCAELLDAVDWLLLAWFDAELWPDELPDCADEFDWDEAPDCEESAASGPCAHEATSSPNPAASQRPPRPLRGRAACVLRVGAARRVMAKSSRGSRRARCLPRQ